MELSRRFRNSVATEPSMLYYDVARLVHRKTVTVILVLAFFVVHAWTLDGVTRPPCRSPTAAIPVVRAHDGGDHSRHGRARDGGDHRHLHGLATATAGKQELCRYTGTRTGIAPADAAI